jgi:hypothetical protein
MAKEQSKGQIRRGKGMTPFKAMFPETFFLPPHSTVLPSSPQSTQILNPFMD